MRLPSARGLIVFVHCLCSAGTLTSGRIVCSRRRRLRLSKWDSVLSSSSITSSSRAVTSVFSRSRMASSSLEVSAPEGKPIDVTFMSDEQSCTSRVHPPGRSSHGSGLLFRRAAAPVTSRRSHSPGRKPRWEATYSSRVSGSPFRAFATPKSTTSMGIRCSRRFRLSQLESVLCCKSIASSCRGVISFSLFPRSPAGR